MTKKEFVVIFIFTLFVVITWAVTDIVRTPPSETVDPKLQKALQPVNGSFDNSVIQKLNSTDYLQVAVIQSQPQTTVPVEKIIPSSAAVATDSAKLEQTATESANIPQ